VQFENNFVGLGNDTAPTFVNGSSAWKTYIGNANYDSPHDGENYYDFRYGDVAFFVLDTRRHRTDVTQAAATSQTMLGEKQLAALYQWFAKVGVCA
jgi:alkaline phosphatase D